MEPIRIVLADLPRMLRDILYASLRDEPDVVLVGEVATLEELTQLVKQGGVDVVVLGLADADLPASYYRLFETDAQVRILAITDHGRNTSLYELRPYRIELGEGSPQELTKVLQAAVRSRWDHYESSSSGPDRASG